MQFLKQVGFAATAAAALLAILSTTSTAAERKAGSFEFFASIAGGFQYADGGNSNGGTTSFAGGGKIGFDIATNNDGVALGVEGGYDYFGDLPAQIYWITVDAETDGFSVGPYAVIPVSSNGDTRLKFGAGAVFWKSEIDGVYGPYYVRGSGEGTGYYVNGGVDFAVAGPLHAGIDLRFSQLASDMYIISPQFRFGLHF